MHEVEALKRLHDFGFSVTMLARECHCSQAAIAKYLSGQSLPNGSKTLAIKDGLEHILNTIEAIVRE